MQFKKVNVRDISHRWDNSVLDSGREVSLDYSEDELSGEV